MQSIIEKLLNTELDILKHLIELAIKEGFKDNKFFLDFLDELNALSVKY